MLGFFVLDGRMPFPVNHGTSSEDSLLQVIPGMHLSVADARLSATSVYSADI